MDSNLGSGGNTPRGNKGKNRGKPRAGLTVSSGSQSANPSSLMKPAMNKEDLEKEPGDSQTEAEEGQLENNDEDNPATTLPSKTEDVQSTLTPIPVTMEPEDLKVTDESGPSKTTIVQKSPSETGNSSEIISTENGDQTADLLPKSKLEKYSKRQWTLLLFFGLIDFLAAITISLQAPFYPAEAERKGANATEYGFVFGIFEFIVFMVSPVYGKFIHKIGPTRVFNASIILESVAVITFGLLDRINDRTTFVALCLLCRTIEALGAAGFFLATFTIIACEFPTQIARVFASLETAIGLGLICGPTIGGAIYGIGGFPLPFFVVGVCLFLTGVMSYFLMPNVEKASDAEAKLHGAFGPWDVFKIPSIALATIGVASTSMSFGFVSAVLEPHIRMFNLTPFQTGLVFVVNGGVYAVTAPILGYFCDHVSKPIYFCILGNFFIFVSFIWIGPAAFIPLDTILWVTCIGLMIQGLGFTFCFVPGFVVGLQDALKNGLPDNISTYGLASGVWQSAISLGAWLGPVLAGVLFDLFGFRQASWLILGISSLVGTATFIYAYSAPSTAHKLDTESQPLLRPSSPPTEPNQSEDPKPSTSYGST